MRPRFAVPETIRMRGKLSDQLGGFALSPVGQYSTGIALALVAIIGLAVLVLQLRDAIEEITVQIPFTHRAEFTYFAKAVITEESLGNFIEDPEQIEQVMDTVYAGIAAESVEDLDAHTGSPIFPRIHPIAEIQIVYTIDGPVEASFQGAHEYIQRLSDVTGWKLDIPAISSESITGSSAFASVVFPTQPTIDQLESLELITGHVPRQYSGILVGQIDMTVTYRGRSSPISNGLILPGCGLSLRWPTFFT